MKRTRKKSKLKETKKKSNMMEAKRPELLAMAKSHGIKGRHRMTRDELISALEPHIKKTPATEDPEMPVRSAKGPALPVPPSPDIPKRQGYYDLPWSYGETELVLMPVDPCLIYAYWDFSPDDWKDIQDKGERIVLRIYDVTMIRFNGTNAHHFFDIPVTLESQNWYIRIWSAEKSLLADIGWSLSDGSFHLISRSNVIQTPRAGVSAFDETRWLEVRQARRKSARQDLLRALQLKRMTAPSDKDRDKRPSFWDPLIAEAGSTTKEGAGGLSSREIWITSKTNKRA